ncbi:MFS transporter [Roseomonas xinghualingensis]|uniref:MFS transporter n=1 Tax=Roseomonas xinghualingensis TaxID=2986475 RepID=UPI0021F14BAF|nr:MFS transporter [Roseomonas sp. SXEYE001]MCV4209311.1 MFS transporter [Roseomonas sp. SXEYE001]
MSPKDLPGGPPAQPGLAGASWKVALAVTLLMQTVAAFLNQCVPVLAPLLTGSAGLPPEAAGHLAALATLGILAFLIIGNPFLARLGPVRTLQWGAIIGAAGLAIASLGGMAALAVASLLVGIGYGPTPPAGSRILAATAPARHRSLIFSVKQAGAPLGGMLAGLLVAPVAASFGWSTALAMAVAIAALSAILIQPSRAMLDVEREPDRPIHPRALLDRGNLVGPFAALRLHPLLPPLTWLACSLATVQGCFFAFAVTWLTQTRDMTLVQAGAVFAAMQAGGVLARVVLGWMADRTGNAAMNLIGQGLGGAAVVAVFVLLPPLGFWWTLLLGLLSGSLVASWNGIYQAEVARLSPPGRVAEATAGSTTLCFLGYLIPPAIFAALVTATGSWLLPQLLASGQLLLVALMVLPKLRRHGHPA